MDIMYPIATLITETMKARGLTRERVCHSLGYSKAGKAFQTFDKCMQHGHNGGPFFMQRLVAVLQVDPERLKEAFAETHRIQALEASAPARATFKPHLWVDPEMSVPSQILIVAFCGENVFKRAELPDGITALPLDEQKAIVKRTVLCHFGEKKGTAGPFGMIMGYRYKVTFDDYWRVSTAGEFVEMVYGDPTLSRATLSVGGKAVETGRDGLLSIFSRPPVTLTGRQD